MTSLSPATRVVVLVGLTLTTLACGGGGAATTFEGGCTVLARGWCDFYQRCYPEIVDYFYGTPETCRAIGAANCAPYYDLPGSHTTPANLDACGRAYMAASCEIASLASCAFPPGDVPVGGACAAQSQCASGICEDVSGEPCGACAEHGVTIVPVGGSCDTQVTPPEYCESGTTCIEEVCRPVAREGESCTEALPCTPDQYYLECVEGTCVQMGQAGQPCYPPASCARGYSCDLDSRLCGPNRDVHDGEDCTPLKWEQVECVGGYCACPTTANSTTEICRAYPAVGQPCLDTSNVCGADIACARGLTCTDGICGIPVSQPPSGCGPQ